MKTKNSTRRPTLKKMLRERIVNRQEVVTTLKEDFENNKYHWGNMITARINSENEKEEK